MANNIDENADNEIIDLNPYIEAFNFFKEDKNLGNKYSEALNKLLQQSNTNSQMFSETLEKYISYYLDKYFKENKNETDEIKYKRKKCRTNPIKIFDYFLDELHKFFNYKKKEENEIQSVEINKEKALSLFNNFANNDKSYISENFFGRKSIEKKCKECKMTHYLFKYLKSIPIKIEDMNKEVELDIELYLQKMHLNFTKEEFCTICSKKTIQEIVIGLDTPPKIMILVFISQKNLSYEIKGSLFKDMYNLIAAETKQKKKSLFDIIDLLSSFCLKRKNFRYFSKESLKKSKDDVLDIETPYVLFYEKNLDRIVEIQNEEKKSREELIKNIFNGEKNNNKINDDNNKIIKNDQKSHDNNGLISDSDEEKTNNINNITKEEDDSKDNINDITLYFKFPSKGKELYLDTKNNIIFIDIIKALQLKYKDFELKIDVNKLYFNKKKLAPEKTPKYYKIPNESRIIIEDS